MDALFCHRGFCAENCERRDSASKDLSSRSAWQGRGYKKKGPCTETVVKTRHIEEKSTSGVVCPPEKGRADAGNNPTSARPFFQFLLLVLE